MNLTPEELSRLTRRDKPKAQARVLRALGIPFTDDTFWHSLLVSREEAEHALGNANYRDPPAPIELSHEDADPFDRPWGDVRPDLWFMANWHPFLPPIAEILRSRTTVETFLADGHLSRHVVYFLMGGWEIFYVGQTRNAEWRFADHRARFKQLSHVAFIRVPRRLVDTVESFYIMLLDPPYNVRRGGGSFQITDDLLKRAKRGKLYRGSGDQ